MKRDKRTLLAAIASSVLDIEAKRELIKEMLETGQVTDNDVAQMMLDDIDQNWKRWKAVVEDDELIQYLVNEYRNQPNFLARMLVCARPKIFYAYGLAIRLILKLRADLGTVLIRPANGFGTRGKTQPAYIEKLAESINPEIFKLEVECRFREFLPFFADDFREGMNLLEEEINASADVYRRRLLKEVRKLAEKLATMKIPGVAWELYGRPFPAFHVRWWLEQARNQPRTLNMGDTGSYKTSFALIAMHMFGVERTLVLTPAHARDNGHWQNEIQSYFLDPPEIQVIRRRVELEDIDPDAKFVIVGYNTITDDKALGLLLNEEFDGLVRDESHYGNNIDAQTPASIKEASVKRAFACMQLSTQKTLKRYIALSATPWENRPDEFAAMAISLKPELFPNPDIFNTSGAARQPRFMRELVADHVLDVETRDVAHLPKITPQPWNDLFGAVMIDMCPGHRKIYRAIRNHPDQIEPTHKIRRLLQAAIHPPLLLGKVPLDPAIEGACMDPTNSTKLMWIKRYIEERIGHGKIAVLSGLYAEGITRHENSFTDIAELFREWFGYEAVVVIDGAVALHGTGDEASPRNEAVKRWRTCPKARILLLSTQAAPDSINLSIKRECGAEKLYITALSFGWKPWKQNLGRFWRQGQEVPIEYNVPILKHTIDENLLIMLKNKWQAQLLFRALAPMTDNEMRYLSREGLKSLTDMLNESADYVNLTFARLRGADESQLLEILDEPVKGGSTASVLAEKFLDCQDYATSGHIARYMRKTMKRWHADGLIAFDRILDAGCGPLTLERYLDQPVHGIDISHEMIDLARPFSKHGGVNTRVGRLSSLPKDWTHKFELTVASLVLDLSNITSLVEGVPLRARILQELVRVTDPQGLVWLTWNQEAQSDETFSAWKAELQRQDMVVKNEVSGLVVSTDYRENSFSFWSLVFSPNGRTLDVSNAKAFTMASEQYRLKDKRGSQAEAERKVIRKREVRHEHFEVRSALGALADIVAAERGSHSELKRIVSLGSAGRKLHRTLEEIHQVLGHDWRSLAKAQEHGVLHP